MVTLLAVVGAVTGFAALAIVLCVVIIDKFHR